MARAHGLYRSMHQPHSTNSLRSTDEPRRLIRPLRSVSPDWYCRGRQAGVDADLLAGGEPLGVVQVGGDGLGRPARRRRALPSQQLGGGVSGGEPVQPRLALGDQTQQVAVVAVPSAAFRAHRKVPRAAFGQRAGLAVQPGQAARPGSVPVAGIASPGWLANQAADAVLAPPPAARRRKPGDGRSAPRRCRVARSGSVTVGN